ncbi:MAG: 16S rRNA (guanine(966)-N(2))-methyltransferase RsmD [Desulfovibrio sp.]|nr:16S rRNA (guanine(966)-N(2))-methyltransferase RsmD [Desulfovibrio sp.]
MRIIAGRLRSRQLKSPKGSSCRPAMGRTREALFSMLEARGLVWSEAHVLDIFAGSGSLAFEAISRGAPYALLLENSPLILRCLHDNIHSLDLAGQVEVLTDDALRILRTPPPEPFDVVFLDPPYRQGYAERALMLLVKQGWLAPAAFVAAEIEEKLRLRLPASLSLVTERLFGQTRLVLLRASGQDSETGHASQVPLDTEQPE